MSFEEKFYVINSTSYIKSVPTRLDKDFKKDIENVKENRKDQRTKMQATQQSQLIDQRKTGKPPKSFESAGNDIMGGGFSLEAFEPR